jgi:hypothetical protein
LLLGLGGPSAGTLASSQLGAEGIETGAPVLAELVEPAIDLLQRLRIDGIKPPGSLCPYGGEAGFSKHPQMLGNRWLADAKFPRDGLHHGSSGMLSGSE